MMVEVMEVWKCEEVMEMWAMWGLRKNVGNVGIDYKKNFHWLFECKFIIQSDYFRLSCCGLG